MGVIKKVLYRGNVLSTPRHKHFFLDMEENIHIHYRDLRVELSRAEFEDIAKAFAVQSQELLAIIGARDYQDGKLPNANQDEVRIWTDSLLKHPVRYHPRRVSLEECTDGYHLHLRNHKILLAAEDFRALAQVFRSIDMDGPYAASYEEVVALFEANDVDFTLAVGNVPGEVFAALLPQHHVAKAQAILTSIGFTTDPNAKDRVYQGKRLKVRLAVDARRKAEDYANVRAHRGTVRLLDYLMERGPAIDANELNRMGCQVLDLYYALLQGQNRPIEDDVESWFYNVAEQRVVFPWRQPGAASGAARAQAIYQQWYHCLDSLRLGFTKPVKRVYPKPQQQQLLQRMRDWLTKELTTRPAVQRIHLMGSSLRGDMGRYDIPFVYRRHVKVGSDIDMLIEIDPEQEKALPNSWKLYMERASNNTCAVYHLGELAMAEGISDWQALFPSIPFTAHLLEAYVFLPSRCDAARKDAFLKEFHAEVFYDRDANVMAAGGQPHLIRQIEEAYGFDAARVDTLKEASGNRLYRVAAGATTGILKITLDAGTYSRRKLAEHARYEACLILALQARGISTPGVIASRTGLTATIDGYQAILFECFTGDVCDTLEYPTAKAATALAQLHRVQQVPPLGLTEEFAYDDFCAIWMPYFRRSYQTPDLPKALADACASMATAAAYFDDPDVRSGLLARSQPVHCHGDVKPRNVIQHVDGSVAFFDFDNALFAPRLTDAIDGGITFSLAEQHIDRIDFQRFDVFLAAYRQAITLTAAEEEDLPQWIQLCTLLQFIRELTTWTISKDGMRLRRAVAIAHFAASLPSLHQEAAVA